MRLKHFAPPVLALVSMLLLGGCFETTLNLISRDAAKVDVAYVGDWDVPVKGDDGTTAAAQLIIRNIDGKQYYVEWKDPNESEPLRMVGFTGVVKGRNFAQLTKLGGGGTNSSDHLIVRLELVEGKLTLRQLKKEFFEGVTTDEQLKAKVAENVENPAMYDESATCTKRPTPAD